MIDLMKKAVFTGIGLAALTQEKARELAREMANQLQLTGDRGREFIDDVVAESERARQNAQEAAQRYVSEALHRMNVPTQADIARLTERIEQLERTLAEKMP